MDLEIEFIQTTKRIGLSRAQDILKLLAVYEGNITQAGQSGSKHEKTARVADKNFVPIQLTEGEKVELDRQLVFAHETGNTPILNGAKKFSRVEEFRNFIQKNPGVYSRSEAPYKLIEQFKQFSIMQWRATVYLDSNNKKYGMTTITSDGKLVMR